ncbi:MAG: ROK family protein [Bacillota bacterium]
MTTCMLQTGDSTMVKQLNKSIILNCIRRSSPISRASLSRVTGLNKSTVSVLTAELQAEQQIIELGAGHSTGGRRPQLLSFNGQVGLTLGIEVGVTFIRGVLCDLMGRVLVSHEVPMPAGQSVDSTLSSLLDLAHHLVAQAPRTPMGILGVGVGVPGVVNTAQGTVLLAPNLGWRDLQLRTLLEQSLGLPVYLENEANAAALGEKWFGVGAEVPNLIYLSLGMGIGTGVIVNGQLFRGSHGLAGEAGHQVVEAGGAACNCGNRGCWELYASEGALRRRLRDLNLDTDSVHQLAESGDARVISAVSAVGEYLGIGLVSLLNIFDPELVVVGGPLARFGKWLINPAERVLGERLMLRSARRYRIAVSSLGENSCALGAASILVEAHFSTTGA